MVTRFATRSVHYGILSAAAGLLFFWNLGAASLWDVDEARNATCAQEMREAGNWIVPTFNGQLRPDKPALLYWLQGLAYHLLGVNEFAARLPSALAALAAVLLAYELGRRLFGKTTGFLGALIAASSPMLMGAARFANPDSLLHLFTLLTLFIFWRGHLQPSAWWWVGLGVASGLGMLAKGPVAVLLPGAIGLAYLLWQRQTRLLLDYRIIWAGLAWFLVAAPWYIWVAVETKGRFLQGFFLRHNVSRFVSTMESHDGTPLFYPIVLLVGLAPWSIFLVAACWHAWWSARREPGPRWRSIWERTADRQQRGHPEAAPPPWAAYRFLLCWIGVYLVFFTIAATKLPNYVLPTVVPCALLTGRLLERWRLGQVIAPAWYFPTALALWLAFGVALGAGLALAGGAIDLPALRGRAVPGLAAFAWLGVIPLVGAGAAWALLRQDRRSGMLAALGLAAVLAAAPLAAWAQTAVNRLKPIEGLVEQSGAFNRTEDIRIVACYANHLPSLNFYTQREVIHLGSANDVAGYLHYPIRVFVFLPAEAWEHCRRANPNLGRELARHRDLYTGRDLVVVTNQ